MPDLDPVEAAFPRDLNDCLRWLTEYGLLQRRVRFTAEARGAGAALDGSVDFHAGGVDLQDDEYTAHLTWEDLLAPEEEHIRAKEERLQQEAEAERRRREAEAVRSAERRMQNDLDDLSRLIRRFPAETTRILGTPPHPVRESRDPRLRPQVGDAVSWSSLDAGRPVTNTARVAEIDVPRDGLFVVFKPNGARYFWTLAQWQLDNGNTVWLDYSDSWATRL